MSSSTANNYLAYLVICNSFVSDEYLNDIYDMICQNNHLHLKQYFIQEQHDLNLQHLY